MNNEFNFLDILTILSYSLQLKNLEENRKQTEELEYHLKQQDEILEKQNEILNKLNGGK